MSTINAQIDAVRILAKVLTPWHLMRSGAVSRKSEADHLSEMLKDVTQTLEEANDRGVLEP